MPIDHISDTARWVAMYRAMESERTDAIFRDPYARRLAGAQGEAILRQMPQGRAIAWSMIVRTAVFDELILDLVRRHQVDVILDLAAGLDARPWRLPLPPALTWIDVDLPAILAYKAEMMGRESTVCRYEAISADLTNAVERTAALSRANAAGNRVLVVTEGLLIYLTSDEVRSLASDLAAQPHVHWWMFDLVSPRLLAMIAKRLGRSAQQGHATFRFAPPEGIDFFRPSGWQPAAFRSMLHEAHRLHREMRGALLWRLLLVFARPARREEYRKMSGVAVVERF